MISYATSEVEMHLLNKQCILCTICKSHCAEVVIYFESILLLKGALDKFNIIPNFFPKKSWDFYTIRSVGMSKDCMPSFTF